MKGFGSKDSQVMTFVELKKVGNFQMKRIYLFSKYFDLIINFSRSQSQK